MASTETISSGGTPTEDPIQAPPRPPNHIISPVRSISRPPSYLKTPLNVRTTPVADPSFPPGPTRTSARNPSPDTVKESRLGDFCRNIYHYGALTWLDWVTMVILTALGLALWLWGGPKYLEQRTFPMWKNSSTGQWEGELRYSYPHAEYVFSVGGSGFLIFAIPIIKMTSVQLGIRRFWDWHAALMGVLKVNVLMFLVIFLFKAFIGGFRPFFLTMCDPDPSTLDQLLKSALSRPNHHGSGRVYPAVQVCRWSRDGYSSAAAQQIRATGSFPSGHAGTAFAVAIFTALYLNGKLKPFARRGPVCLLRLLVILLPLLWACIAAGAVMVDRHHHGTDITFGMLIGTFIGAFIYRSHFQSFFDNRANHLPVPYQGQYLFNNHIDGMRSDPYEYTFRRKAFMESISCILSPLARSLFPPLTDCIRSIEVLCPPWRKGTEEKGLEDGSPVAELRETKPERDMMNGGQ
ncbi:hypothetical protein MMC25_002068 [Agyrium rufum]|nr:hypothetical protein [Agyrium rufum]